MKYQPYPHNQHATLVKALYKALRLRLITRAEFAACLRNFMGEHR